jgi:hypothetical protein
MLMGMYITASGFYRDGKSAMGLHISAWASALLVQLNRAMPEPHTAGRVTVQTLTLFLC